MTEIEVSPLTLALFGPMHVRVEGQPLPHLRSRKALWLLALLTLRHDKSVERVWLSGLLWPDVDQETAFANLRPVLSELRRAMGNQGDRLQSPNRHTLCLELEGADADVLDFDVAMKSKQLAALERAVALYRGPLLEGCNEEWVFQERSTREQACLQAFQQLAENSLISGDTDRAIGYYHRAVGIDPLWDTARRGLMEALAQGGNVNEAMQVYRSFHDLLRKEMNADPDERTSALYSRLREGTSQPIRSTKETVVERVPERAQPPAVTGYLPHPLTELVGREDERVEVAERLRESRLVTLTGFGGIGKTRLAMEVAAEVAGDYPEGVWWVALESLTEEKQVAVQIISVLGVKEEPGNPLIESVIGSLRRKRLLLVLDNCEHLREASARIAERLLREGAGVRVLATSREALGVPGETTWAVPSLATPDPQYLPQDSVHLHAALMSYESVRLFVERARAVRKDFTLTANNTREVAKVCSQLEGIPLAIELAAARVKAMTLNQISERLQDHLSLIMGRGSPGQSRQQTLRATLDWSNALLTHTERVLLRRVSVFVGGWSLESAEAVCAGGEIEPGEILDLLASLIDKSLVLFTDRDAETGGRYRLTDAVRQYAAERLEESGETGLVRARHWGWYLALAEGAEPQLTGARQEVWLRRLEADYDNFRAALAWSNEEAPSAEAGLRLTGLLGQYWQARGHYSEGLRYLRQALDREGAQAGTEERAFTLVAAAAMAYSQSDYDASREMYEEALGIFRQQGNRRRIAETLGCLGNIAHGQGSYDDAFALYEENLNISRELGDSQGIAWSLGNLGKVAYSRGDYEVARDRFAESLQLFREIGDIRAISWAVHFLGTVALDRGDVPTARMRYEEALDLAREMKNKPDIAWSLSHMGNLAHRQGEWDVARAYYEESLGIFREIGESRGIAWSLRCLGDVCYATGDPASAQPLYEESLSLRRRLGELQGTAWSLNRLGRVLHDQGKHAAARQALEESLKIFRDIGEKRGMTESLEVFAALLRATSEVRRSVVIWGAAHAVREVIGVPLPDSERERYDRWVGQARSELGEADFTAAWEVGSALSWEQVAALLDEELPA